VRGQNQLHVHKMQAAAGKIQFFLQNLKMERKSCQI
jgi:hypothetical protein